MVNQHNQKLYLTNEDDLGYCKLLLDKFDYKYLNQKLLFLDPLNSPAKTPVVLLCPTD